MNFDSSNTGMQQHRQFGPPKIVMSVQKATNNKAFLEDVLGKELDRETAKSSTGRPQAAETGRLT